MRRAPIAVTFLHLVLGSANAFLALASGALEIPPMPSPVPIARANRLKADLPLPRRDDRYLTSASCLPCHEEEYASWHRSYHRTMTQAAEDGQVAGDFGDITVRSSGLEYRVFQRDGAYFAEMPDPDRMMLAVQGGKGMVEAGIPRVIRPVVMATGSHHYQTYWVSSSRFDRLLQTLPLVYLLKDHRWIPREAAFMRGPGDRDRLITQWNHHCIRCHSTGGNPGLDDASGQLRSEVGELGISCEACHGPGGDHVRLQRSVAAGSDARGGRPGLDRTIVNPARLDHRRSSQVCGQCHGVYIMRDEFAMDAARHGPLFRPGDDLQRTRYYIQFPRPGSDGERLREWERNREFFRERWWDDGTILAGGREYTGLSASACYIRGTLGCANCHSQHSSEPDGQVKPVAMGAGACVGCHRDAKYTSEVGRHTFHLPGSTGSDCLNCHMPRTSYGLLKAIRSHQIQSPQVLSSALHGVPNACNLCHLDRTLEWAGRHLTERYGQARVELTHEQQSISAALLWMLKGHAAQRVITAWHAGWKPALDVSGADWIAPFEANLLTDPYGVVRYVAHRSLQRLPGFADYSYDFLAGPVDLGRRASDVKSVWLSHGRPSNPIRDRPELLLGSDGLPIEERVRSLLGSRDDRPVTIKE